MGYRRKIYDKLLERKKEDRGTSAILINGARRVGKSYIAEEFGKREYRNYVLIDFTKADERIKSVFRNSLSNLDDFFYQLSNLCGKSFHERETLFIFDEVQAFPRAREAVKHLVAHGKYDYIETGSLVSIRKNVKDILIPEFCTCRFIWLHFFNDVRYSCPGGRMAWSVPKNGDKTGRYEG